MISSPESHIGEAPSTKRPWFVPSYRRWFVYLAIGSVLSLVHPYLSSRDSRFYSPAIDTFHETSAGLQPTQEHIWIDGRAAGRLQSHFWIGTALLLVCLDAASSFVQAKRRRR